MVWTAPSPSTLINLEITGVGVSSIATLNNALLAFGLLEYKIPFVPADGAVLFESSTYR